MEDMQKLMRGETDKETKDNKADTKKVETRERESPSGYPNPLGLDLLDCHVPRAWIKDKHAMMEYCKEHFTMNEMQSVDVNEQENELFGKYVNHCRSAGIPPITSRYFATAIRCIAAGMPIHKESPLRLRDMQL